MKRSATDRLEILRKLNSHIKVNGHILGVAAGSGMTTKYSVKGGADIILALSAGRFRQMGRASIASYLCFANSNDLVSELAARELVTLIDDTPILFGLNATDPLISLDDYIAGIKAQGLAGIVNFPTVGLIDGQFREALEECGIDYETEVNAIRIAANFGMFTLAFVFDEEQARMMIDAGADVICAHLGWTAGGALGAAKVESIEAARERAERIFDVCEELAPDRIRMIYGGPVKSPSDAQYFYDNTSCQGFIGGSSFERIPAEKAILNTTQSFKRPHDVLVQERLEKILEGRPQEQDYIEFVQHHIEENYHQTITLGEMATALHLTPSYLSSIFKKKLGCSFTEYLVKFRMNQAADMLSSTELSVSEIAENCGYLDAAQFSKMFKKYKGMSPRAYRLAGIQL